MCAGKCNYFYKFYQLFLTAENEPYIHINLHSRPHSLIKIVILKSFQQNPVVDGVKDLEAEADFEGTVAITTGGKDL